MTYTTVTGLTRKADRVRFIKDVERAIATDVPEAKLDRLSHEDGELVMGFTVPGKLSVTFRHSKGSTETPFLSWYGAASRLRGGAGTGWRSWDINRAHGCKATSFPTGLNQLIATLLLGLLSAHTGSAFAEGVEA
jgi:hypothetical protein